MAKIRPKPVPKEQQKKRRRQRTREEIQDARREAWRSLGGRHTGNYSCVQCGEIKYCRGTTLRRMSCELCFITKGAPKIPQKVSRTGTLAGQPTEGRTP